MRAEFINPFLQAATEVLEAELGSVPTRGSVGLQRSSYTSDDVTAVVAVTGSIAGRVMFAMTERTSRCCSKLAPVRPQITQFCGWRAVRATSPQHGQTQWIVRIISSLGLMVASPCSRQASSIAELAMHQPTPVVGGIKLIATMAHIR